MATQRLPLFSLLVFILVQNSACTCLELKIPTSCEDIKTPGGFNYSYEIPEELQIEQWNSTVVLARRETGTDPQWSSEVKEFSHGWIILCKCMNVSYWSVEVLHKERWIHFIVEDAANMTDEYSASLTVGLSIFFTCILIVILAGIIWIMWKKKCTCGPPCDRWERNAGATAHYTPAEVECRSLD